MNRATALHLLGEYCAAARAAGPGLEDEVGMLDRFPEDGSENKAMRWLGYIQGALVNHGVYDLEDVKRHSSRGWVLRPMTVTCQIGYREPFMLTRSGLKVYLQRPEPWDMVLSDIAYAPAHLNRYTGHVGPYSVAQHAVLCAIEADYRGLGVDVVRACLMHDAAEAYVGDVSSPLKRLCPGYRKIEARFEDAIADRFHVDTGHPMVKEIDRIMLMEEATRMLPGVARGQIGWVDAPRAQSPRVHQVLDLAPWSAADAERFFLGFATMLGIR